MLLGASQAAGNGRILADTLTRCFLVNLGTLERVEGRAYEVTFAKVKKEKGEPNSAPAGVE